MEVLSCFDHLPRRTRRLVGVSGGADSVALLHLLVAGGFRNLVVCHLNHGLRGRAAAGDARFVGALARRLQLPCETGRADVRGRMHSTGESLETAARAERLRFFAGCARKYRCRQVLLAHHADDQAETVLWNLLRGSRGLRGMRAHQDIQVDGLRLRLVRPLLGCRREDLLRWLNGQGHRWREDASNALPLAVRNRLRNEVLPLIAQVTGRDPVNAMLRALADWEELAALERDLLAGVRLLDPQGRIHLPTFRALPPALRRTALRDYLEARGQHGIDRSLLDRGCDLAEPDAQPAINLPGGGRLRRSGGRLWVDPGA